MNSTAPNSPKDSAAWFDVLMPNSPYAVLPALGPNSSRQQIHRHKLHVQKTMRRDHGGMSSEQDDAFRRLFKPPARAVWDLFALGTTPGVTADQWRDVADALPTARRSEIQATWAKQIRKHPPDLTALHVSALLALDQAMREEAESTTSESTLKQVVALWASLLLQQDWLIAFLEYRFRTWGWKGVPEERSLFLQRIDQQSGAMLDQLASGRQDRRDLLLGWWTQETTSIQAMRGAGVDGEWRNWTPGFGPHGLDVLGEANDARRWLLKTGRAYRGGTPLAALAEGAKLTDRDPEKSCEAATGVHWLCSELGSAAADIWNGLGRSAGRRLDQWRVNGAPAEEHSWFGDGEAGLIRRQRAADEMRAEAGLVQFVEDIGRSEVEAVNVLEAFDRVLQQVDSHRQPRVLLEQSENVVCGRVLDCLQDFRKSLTVEVTRVLRVADAIHARLVERNAGDRLAKLLSGLYRARSVRRWNQACDLGFRMPNAVVQSKCLQDVLRAVDLTPTDPSPVEALGRFLAQEDQLSPAERKPILERAVQCIDRILADGAGAEESQMRDLRRKLFEELDPDAARRETQEEIARVLRKKS